MKKTPRDVRSQRLYLRAALSRGAKVPLDRAQTNYLLNVLRLSDGAAIRVFNGQDGEWEATLAVESRKSSHLVLDTLTQPQPQQSDLHYLFAPLKQARLGYMVEKAVEMGVGRLRPVLTQHGQVQRINAERLQAHAVEAAEQCGLLTVPPIDQPRPLKELLGDWDKMEGGRRIVFCDESHTESDPVAVLSAIDAGPLAVLVGPEGGFSEAERQLLRTMPSVSAVPLGPRIMRADTAAVAALALVQAVLGDWRNTPPPPYSS